MNIPNINKKYQNLNLNKMKKKIQHVQIMTCSKNNNFVKQVY